MKKNILRSNIVTLFLLCTLLSSCYLTNVQGLIRSDREKSSNTTIKKNSNSKIRFRKIAGKGVIIGGTILLASLGIFFYLKKQVILGNRKISALPSNKRNEVASTISTHNANQEVVGDDQNNDSKDNSNGDPPENQLTEKVKNVKLENPIKNSQKSKGNQENFYNESDKVGSENDLNGPNEKVSVLPPTKRSEVASTISTHNASQEVVGDDQKNDSKDNSNGDPPENQLTEKVKNVKLENPIKNSQKSKGNQKNFYNESDKVDSENDLDDPNQKIDLSFDNLKNEPLQDPLLVETLQKLTDYFQGVKPYFFNTLRSFTYEGNNYDEKDVKGDGHCWLYKGAAIALHAMKKCPQLYERFPTQIKKIAKDYTTFVTKHYEPWRKRLEKTLQKLEKSSYHHRYIQVFRENIDRYQTGINKLSKNYSPEIIYEQFYFGFAPGETSEKWYDFLNKPLKESKKRKGKLYRVWKSIKPISTNKIRWFPDVLLESFIKIDPTIPDGTNGREIGAVNYHEIVSYMRLRIKELQKLLYKDDETALKYIKDMITNYKKWAEKIVRISKDFSTLASQAIAIIQHVHKQSSHLKKQLVWLNEHPKEMAIYVLLIKLEYFFDTILHNGKEMKLIPFSGIDCITKRTFSNYHTLLEKIYYLKTEKIDYNRINPYIRKDEDIDKIFYIKDDGKKEEVIGIMGLGTNVSGYGHGRYLISPTTWNS